MSTRPVYVLFLTQTGTAEGIAELVISQSKTKLKGPAATLVPAPQSPTIPWSSNPIVIMIASTTGEGAFPDHALRLHSWLRKAEPNSLSGVDFTVLALGNSTYARFCNCGKTLRDLCLHLGAKEFYPIGLADDHVGLDAVVEPWIDGLWEALATALEKSPTNAGNESALVNATHAENPAKDTNKSNFSFELIFFFSFFNPTSIH